MCQERSQIPGCTAAGNTPPPNLKKELKEMIDNNFMTEVFSVAPFVTSVGGNVGLKCWFTPEANISSFLAHT